MAIGARSQADPGPQFYVVIIAATLVGMAINFLGINPITALVLSAVLNGLIAAPLLVLVMLVSNDQAAMGERTNGRLLNVVGEPLTPVQGTAPPRQRGGADGRRRRPSEGRVDLHLIAPAIRRPFEPLEIVGVAAGDLGDRPTSETAELEDPPIRGPG